MEVICYVCNKQTKEYSQNLVETKSKHTGTPICEFITKFLCNYVSLRDLDDAKNCICSICLSRIYSYDWMCLKVKEQERDFNLILLTTEKQFVDRQVKTEDCVGTKRNVANGRIKLDDTSIEKKPVISGGEVIKTGTPAENVKKSKPIIIRVVKRVPFLKSKPTNSTVPLKSTATSSAIPIITPTKRIQVKTEGPSGSNAKLLLTPKKKDKVKINVCEFCDEKFTNGSSFEVSYISVNQRIRHFGLIHFHIQPFIQYSITILSSSLPK